MANKFNLLDVSRNTPGSAATGKPQTITYQQVWTLAHYHYLSRSMNLSALFIDLGIDLNSIKVIHISLSFLIGLLIINKRSEKCLAFFLNELAVWISIISCYEYCFKVSLRITYFKLRKFWKLRIFINMRLLILELIYICHNDPSITDKNTLNDIFLYSFVSHQ